MQFARKSYQLGSLRKVPRKIMTAGVGVSLSGSLRRNQTSATADVEYGALSLRSSSPPRGRRNADQAQHPLLEPWPASRTCLRYPDRPFYRGGTSDRDFYAEPGRDVPRWAAVLHSLLVPEHGSSAQILEGIAIIWGKKKGAVWSAPSEGLVSGSHRPADCGVMWG